MADPIQRPLPAAVLTEIAIDFTRPVYLVKMLFPAGTVFMSTGPQITFDGDLYIEGQVSMGTVEWNADGAQSGSLTLSNEGNAASALLLAGTVNDVIVEVYKTYLIAAGGNTDPQLYIKGSMDGANIGMSSSTVDILSTTGKTTFVPNRYHTAAEGFNWLPIDGEIIIWGEEVFILQRQA